MMRIIKRSSFAHALFSLTTARARAALALAALAAFWPAAAHSFEVIAVKNADLKPYQDVLRGFMDSCGCDVRELKLRDEDGKERILQSRADAVMVIGTTVFKKAREIQNLPLIYTMVVPSEAALAPQPNISGVSMDISPSAYMKAMSEVFPKARRIGLLYDPQHTSAFIEEAAKAARSAGLELVTKPVRDPSGMAISLEEMRAAIDVFWMVPDPTVVTPETVEYLLRFSFQHNLPVFSFSKKYVEMGAVAALDFDPYDIGVQAGEIARKLSAGRRDPIRPYARTSHLTINRNVASKMGLTIHVPAHGKGR